jgi:hypothetical protein
MDHRKSRHSSESWNPGFEQASAVRPILDASLRWHDVVIVSVAPGTGQPGIFVC